MTRTQIMIDENLRKEIDIARLSQGESLGEYMRKAAHMRIRYDMRKKRQIDDTIKYLKSNPLKVENNQNWATEGKTEKWLRDLREEWKR